MIYSSISQQLASKNRQRARHVCLFVCAVDIDRQACRRRSIYSFARQLLTLLALAGESGLYFCFHGEGRRTVCSCQQSLGPRINYSSRSHSRRRSSSVRSVDPPLIWLTQIFAREKQHIYVDWCDRFIVREKYRGRSRNIQ